MKELMTILFKERVRSVNDKKAAFFDTQIHSDWAAAEYTQVQRDIIHRVISSAGLAPSMKILEPGCGTGRLTEIMARHVGPTGRVSAVDMSRKMALRCAGRVAGLGNVEVVHGRVEDGTVRRNGYDAVVCHNVFHHFPDKARALRSLTSGLREHGMVLIFHFLSMSEINDPWRKIHPAVLHDTMPPFPDMEALFRDVDMKIDLFSDGDDGYFLKASRSGANQ